MKTIIRTITAVALLLAGTTAYAQSFGAGYVNSSRTMYSDSPADGFYAGFGYSAEIAPGLYLNPGLYYEFLTASSSTNIGSGLVTADSKTTEHYINVPLHLSFGIDLAPTFRLFVYGGPTANVGLASTTEEKGSIVGISGNTTVNNYENDNISRVDILVGGGAGIEVMKKLRLTVGYDLGLLDHDATEDVTLKRNRLTAGAAFIF
ncbi:MAG: PorT family protein [Bacteroidales bacterium]|nr:PorT family protein [Bacteroidales bacterium]